MLKLWRLRLTLLFCCLVSLITLIYLQAPVVHAAPTPQLVLSFPGNNSTGNGAIGGPVGTPIHLAGSGFTGTVSLYSTTNNNPLHCKTGDTTLTPFTPTTATAQQDGTFALDTNWPNSAGTVGAAYYLCVIATNAPNGTLSSNNFTVSPPPTINLSAATITAGTQITISGTNWQPPQNLIVTIVDAQNNNLVTTNATSDLNGNFSTVVTIPANTPGGIYSIIVTPTNNPNQKRTDNNALTVTSNITPTPAITPTPTPTATPTPTPALVTPTPTTSTGGSNSGSTSNNSGGTTNPTGNSSTITFLTVLIGGLGILLVIVGIVLFIMYSRR